jgi:hypothetical protein
MTPLTHVVFLAGALLSACAATTPGAQPHDMSASAHESEGGKHEGFAGQHAAQYEPKAATERLSCQPGSSRSGPNATVALVADACWTSVQNPTQEHLEEAEQHRRHAADHRAASAALRDAEARACAGLGPSDRDMSPFEHREDIVDVRPLRLNEFDARTKTPPEMMVGAVVTFRAVPGLTAEWLQRVVNCHLARNAALGHVVPEMPDCPLVPRGVEARVSSAGEGFAVEIRSNEPKVAREVLARAQRLAPAAPGGPAPQQQKGNAR